MFWTLVKRLQWKGPLSRWNSVISAGCNSAKFLIKKKYTSIRKTGSYKLRGSEQLYSDSKNDKFYLFQVTCIVSHNVKFLQFLETSNFIMKKTPVLQKHFGRVGVREVQTVVECECLNKQKGSVRLVKSKFKIGALDIDPTCYQSVTRRLVNFCIAKLYTGRHSREKLIRWALPVLYKKKKYTGRLEIADGPIHLEARLPRQFFE